MKSEPLVFGRRAGVLNRVVARDVDKGWESLLALLTRVCRVPGVVHVRVEPVVETSFFVLDVDRLGRSIHAVLVLRLEHEHAERLTFAQVSIPRLSNLASFHNLRGYRLEVVGGDLEVARHGDGCWDARERRLFNVDEDVIETCACERTAIGSVRPAWIWRSQSEQCALIGISELNSVEVCHRMVVRVTVIGRDRCLTGSTGLLARVESDEFEVLEHRGASPAATC